MTLLRRWARISSRATSLYPPNSEIGTRILAFVDADVLAAAVSRSILYYAAALPNATFTLTNSPHVEAEAIRNQSRRQVPVATLRERFGWSLADDVSAANSGVSEQITPSLRHR
ncbi:MAG: hypothetical protein FWG25_02775 [Promicromonosporaceae bacterium]|nr:hypothetical protein [Promicromonosporaceae bacterium]